MKKKITALFLLAGLLAGSSVAAHADTFYGEDGWHVSFTQEKKMESNFGQGDLDEAVSGLQPGDNIILSVSLKNEYEAPTDWYMKNSIRESLEDKSSTAGGGAYTYRLVYKAQDGTENVLFDSDTVGGEDVSEAGEGLNEATSGLEDYFYLDTIATGQDGQIVLEVGLEGETQGNSYQDTLAALELSFAVEVNESGTTPGSQGQRAQIVKTGDQDLPVGYIVLMAAGGLILLFFAVRNWRENRKQRKGAA